MSILVGAFVALTILVGALFLAMFQMSNVIRLQGARIRNIENASVAGAQHQVSESCDMQAVIDRLNAHEFRLNALAHLAKLGCIEGRDANKTSQ